MGEKSNYLKVTVGYNEIPLTKMKSSVKIHLEFVFMCNFNCEIALSGISKLKGVMKEVPFYKLLSNIMITLSLKIIAFEGIGEHLLHPNIVGMLKIIKTLVTW